MSRRPYHVVDEFEEALSQYTGAPHAIAVDSCCNALLLSLTWWRLRHGVEVVEIPRRTYVGVAVAVLNAGHEISFHDGSAQYAVRLGPTNVIDSARTLHRDMWVPKADVAVCLSFSVEKQLGVGRGGAILTANPEFAWWATKARHDGRTPGRDDAPIIWPSFHVNMAPDVAARCLWLLDHLPDHPAAVPFTDYQDLSETMIDVSYATAIN